MAFSLRILRQQLGFAGGQEIRQLGLEILDLVHRHVVHETVLHRPQNGDLHLDRDRVVLRLLEDFDDALAAFELRLRLGVEVGAELRERRQFAELRQIALDAAGDLFHRLDLRGGTDARHGEDRRKSPGGCPGRTNPFPDKSGRR